MNLTEPPNLHAKPCVFFVDRSLGRKVVPDALRQAGESVIVHDEYFPQNTRDEQWLERAGKEGWIVLSADKRIRYRANELNALKTAGVRAFILTTKSQMTGAQMSAAFVAAISAIKVCTAHCQGSLIAHVYKDGSVQVVFP